MSILSKDIIKNKILPYLTQGSKGPKLTEDKLVSIVGLILYRLKTGCQWRELPLRQYMEEPYSWQSVFHHFNRWCEEGCWQLNWEGLVRENKDQLDLSSAQMDGTHTPSKRGGEAVSYQGRKSSKTTNSLCICDAKGVLLAVSQPEKGNHNDLYEIEKHFKEMMEMLENVDINPDGLFLNADAGFDGGELRKLCSKYGVIPNICFNKRNGSLVDRDEYFDPLLYKQRTVIEHAFAWLDAYKALLIRYERKTKNWFSLNLLGFFVVFAKKIKVT